MLFLVLGYDYPPPEGPERRQACRPDHLELGQRFYAEKKWLYAAGLLSATGQLVGSLIICDFPSEEALRKEWLNSEPYVLNQVWERIEIHPIRPAPFL